MASNDELPSEEAADRRDDPGNPIYDSVVELHRRTDPRRSGEEVSAQARDHAKISAAFDHGWRDPSMRDSVSPDDEVTG